MIKPGNKILYALLFMILLNLQLIGQETLTQLVRGKIVDKNSGSSLPGANILLLNSDPPYGTAADEDGWFVLPVVPVGRQSFKASFIGYQTLILDNILVTSAKEVVLKIELEESVTTVTGVEVIADYQKGQPLNSMALVSARSFTVEETNKYAGSYGDPSRMVANYAGVVSSRDNRNDIVVRGNSPMGMQYRVDGIEISNPNHYSALGTTGGPVSLLNTNLLANSDFLTGAFPAEFGNAMSGVFDLKLRNGNNEKREYWSQIGWNGLEFGLEGPFSKNSQASYMAAYRYSFVDILYKLGIDLPEVAAYQDLSFKFNIPTKKAGTFKLMGIGGTSSIKITDSNKDPEDWTFQNHGEDIHTGSRMGVLGLSHLFYFNSTASIKTILSFNASEVTNRVDTFSIQSPDHFTWAGEESTENKYSFTTAFSKKFNVKNTMDVGFSFDHYQVNYADSQYYKNSYRHFTNSGDTFNLFRTFVQWQHKFSDNLVSYLGGHYLFFQLNNTSSIEPRLGIKWNLTPEQSLNLGFGLHSQTQPRMMYFVQSPLPDGQYEFSNEQMGLSKSRQIVLGYNYLITEYFLLKAETYYQYLNDIPVTQQIPQYSILNEGTEFFVERQDSLVNEGTGVNYGLELTFEKFFYKNYFFLLTASLFDSKYKGFDKIERNTSFNGNYVFNAVGGYELPVGKHKNRVLIFGLRITLAGGRPYVPYDQEETVKQGEVVYDWERAYEEKYDDYFRSSFRFGMRRNKKKFSTEFVFDLQYRSNSTYVYLYRIDVTTGEIVKNSKMGFYPNSTIRIQF